MSYEIVPRMIIDSESKSELIANADKEGRPL